MKHYIKILLFMLPAILYYGCVESLEPTDNVMPVVSVSWPASNDSVSYGKKLVTYTASDDVGISFIEVYLNDKFNGHYEIKSDGSNPLVYLFIDSSLIHQSIKYYLMVSDGKNSALSSIMTGIYVKDGPPKANAPSNLRYTSTSTSKIKLTWTDNSDNESWFEVYRKYSADQYFSKIKNVNSNITEFTDANLFLGTTYNYRVAAVRVTGTDTTYSYSESITATTLSENVTPPQNLTATVNSQENKVTLSWTGTGWDSTLIERKVSGEPDFIQIGGVFGKLIYDDTKLTMGATNYYRVRRRSSNGNLSDYTDIVSVTVPYFAPKAPSNLKITKLADSDFQFILEWKDNSDNEDGFAIYRKAESESDFSVKYELAANFVRLNISVPSQEVYSFYVKSYKSYNGNKIYSASSNTVNTTGGASTYPRPTNFTVIPLTTSSIKLNWNYDDKEDLVGFKIYRKQEFWGVYDSLIVSKNIREYTDTGLDANTTYYYKIKAVGYYQESDATAEISAKTFNP